MRLFRMVRFRRLATPLSWLVLIWLKAFDELKLIDRHVPIFSSRFWLYTSAEFLLAILACVGLFWGITGSTQARPAVYDPTESRRQMSVLSLLAASSVPNLLFLRLIADRLDLPFRDVHELGIAILVTPVFLGWTWFRLQSPSSNMSPPTAAG